MTRHQLSSYNGSSVCIYMTTRATKKNWKIMAICLPVETRIAADNDQTRNGRVVHIKRCQARLRIKMTYYLVLPMCVLSHER